MFVSIGSTIGKVAQIKKIAVTNQQINAIIPNEEYNPNFVYSLLEKEAEDIKKQASSQAVPIINKTTFEEIECFITTNKTEQTKISEILLSIDNLITLHQRFYYLFKAVNDLIIKSISVFSNSCIICKYVFWVVVILE